MVFAPEINTVGAAIAFAVWALVCWGASTALFRSFPAMELLTWLQLIDRERQGRIRTITWELKHGIKHTEVLAKNPSDPHAARAPLGENDRYHRTAALRELTRRTIWFRVANWLMTCTFCQSVWAALLVGLATRGLAAPLALALSSLGYAAACVAFDGLLRRSAPEEHHAPTCGGR